MRKGSLDHVLIRAAAQGVKQVNLIWYKQMNPDQVKIKITANCHLPKIPPAKECMQRIIKVGE